MEKAIATPYSRDLPIATTKKKVISFSLWGNNPLYTVGAIKNADLAPQIYPGWICRFYTDATVPSEVIKNLAGRDYVEIVSIEKPSDGFLGSFWRFLAINDPDVEITIIRDADSRLNWREKAAVDEWLASNLPFHIMRDHPWHKNEIMAGMWGVKGNLEIKIAMANYLKKHSKELVKGIDQKFLAEVIYPLAKYQSLVHDEFFRGKPFPLPRQNNEYVGQIFRSDGSKVRELDAALEEYLSSQLTVAKQEFTIGQSLKKQGKYEEAAAHFQKAIKADPNYLPARNNLGSTFQEQGRLEEAITCYQNALKINPNFYPSISNLASIYLIKEELNKAEKGFNRVLKIKPDYVHALYHLGLVYKQQAKLEDAIKLFKTAIKHQDNFADGYFQLGQIWECLSEFTLAKTAYQQCQKLNPTAKYLLGHFGFVKLCLCDWENYDAFVKQLIDETTKYVKEDKGTFTLAPFHLNLMSFPQELHLELARYKAESINKSIASNPLKFSYSEKTDKLRVGYVSPDFYGHAVGRLVSGLFERHNRDKFEVFGYKLLKPGDAVTETIKNGCDEFRNLYELSVENAARQINSDGIDILIDLAGYTANSKTEIFAYKPAKFQATFLGYPNTMGADFIQYLLTDKWIVPPELAEYYSEEIIYLPHQFPCSPMEISQQQFTRADFGLPEEGFVFACCNRHYKITPELFDVWMRVLKQVEGSVLWLSFSVEETVENLRRSARERGVAPSRLIFAKKLLHPEYLARLQLADLALDTLIYNGGSTTVAALYVGLPVLTKPGATNAARMGASICASGGMEEMICGTLEEYEAKAVLMGSHPEELRRLRQRLQARNAPLFDLSGFVASLEAALEEIMSYIN